MPSTEQRARNWRALWSGFWEGWIVAGALSAVAFIALACFAWATILPTIGLLWLIGGLR